MSDYIKQLAHRVITHPDFVRGMSEVVGNILENTMRNDLGGDALYIPKMGGRESKQERNALITSKFNGQNIPELAKQFNVTERQIRRILKVK